MDRLDPLDAVDVVYDPRHGLGDEVLPLLVHDHAAADLGARVDRSVVEGGIAYLESRLREEALGDGVVAVDPLEGRGHGYHMGHPYGVPVEVLHGDDAVFLDPFGGEGLLDHEVALSGREGVIRTVGVLGAPDTYHEVIRFGSAFADDVHVAFVKGLEAPYHKGIAVVSVHLHHAAVAPAGAWGSEGSALTLYFTGGWSFLASDPPDSLRGRSSSRYFCFMGQSTRAYSSTSRMVFML